MKKSQLRKLIREGIKSIKKEQFSPGGTGYGAQGCQMCPTGEALLEYGTNWNNMIFTSGQNAGQVTCNQSDNPSGGGPDFCPNWGAGVSFPGGSGWWGCPVGFSTVGGDCETPIAGGYECPIELFPYCCHSYVPGPHQYNTITEPHPNVQQYSDYCQNWVGEDIICYACKGGNVVGNRFAPGEAQKGSEYASCPPGWFETQAEAQADCGEVRVGHSIPGAGRAMSNPNRIDIPQPTRAEFNERKKPIKKSELRKTIREEIQNIYEQPNSNVHQCMNTGDTEDANGINMNEGWCVNTPIAPGPNLGNQFQDAGWGFYSQHASAEECIASNNNGGNCNQVYPHSSYPPPGPFIGGNPMKGPQGPLAQMGKKKPMRRPRRR